MTKGRSGKTNSKLKKCIKITGNGKILYKSTGMNHMLLKKDKNRKRSLLADKEVHTSDKNRVKKAAGF